MLGFKQHNLIQEYLKLVALEPLDTEYDPEDLNEAAEAKASNDTMGKIHELLVGYHLQGGHHMEKHPDKEGDSPKEAHDKLKETLTHGEYAKMDKRAKEAAEDIRKQVEVDGHKIHHVHWTSKPGDIHRSTGVHAAQHEDASDIMISTHKKIPKEVTKETGGALTGNQQKFHGISLKVADSKTPPTISAPGIESTLGGKDIHDKHKAEIIKKFPSLLSAKNRPARKQMMKDNPTMDKFVREKNKKTLESMGKNLHKQLTKMDRDKLVKHIKTHVIHGNPTPLEKQGHEHIRHFTQTDDSGKNHFKSLHPAHHWDHIFNDPSQKIDIEHKGSYINFKHNGKTFASHSLKFNTQSDPLSNITGAGKAP